MLVVQKEVSPSILRIKVSHIYKIQLHQLLSYEQSVWICSQSPVQETTCLQVCVMIRWYDDSLVVGCLYFRQTYGTEEEACMLISNCDIPILALATSLSRTLKCKSSLLWKFKPYGTEIFYRYQPIVVLVCQRERVSTWLKMNKERMAICVYIYNIYIYIHEVNFTMCLTNKTLRHEDLWGYGCIDPRFPDIGNSWRWVVSFTPRRVYPRYPLDRK
jgi:hypothetical protein